MEKIDAHQHFWQYDPITYDWITDDMAVLRRDYLPLDLAPILMEQGIKGCVSVQAEQSEADTHFLLTHAAQNDFVLGVVGWVDLQAADVSDKLEAYRSFPKLKGFRHVVQAEPDLDFMLRPAFLRGIKALESFGYTYDVLIFPHQLAPALELVKRFPNQPFVLDHLAKPYIKKGLIEPWKTDLQALAAHENVCCKISGFVTEANWTGWQAADFRPYLDAAVEVFGMDRLLFGSDWPVCQVAGGYAKVIAVLEDYFSSFSDAEKKAFWGDNAQRFYGLVKTAA
jgi:L-fuconolactonase